MFLFSKFSFFSSLLISLTFSMTTFADIDVSGSAAKTIWNSVKAISILENVEIIETEEDFKSFNINHVQCVFEMYNACSFFTDINSNRKLQVVMDGTAKLMREMARVGVFVDTIHAQIATQNIYCVNKKNSDFNCLIEEYQ